METNSKQCHDDIRHIFLSKQILITDAAQLSEATADYHQDIPSLESQFDLPPMHL